MKRKANDKVGVEMMVLSHEDRVRLMKAVALRRLAPDTPLTKDQFTIAMECDMQAIKDDLPWFKFDEYVGVTQEAFYSSMLIGQIVAERAAPSVDAVGALAPLPDASDLVLVERGQLADELMAGLSDDMTWLVDLVPMSTRGFFDKLKVRPPESQTITMTVDEFNEAHKKGAPKDLIVDHDKNDQEKQLRRTTKRGLIL